MIVTIVPILRGLLDWDEDVLMETMSAWAFSPCAFDGVGCSVVTTATFSSGAILLQVEKKPDKQDQALGEEKFQEIVSPHSSAE